MDLDLCLLNMKHFFINLFSCFSEKEMHNRRYFAKSINDCDIIIENLETTYLFERDDYN